MRANETLLIANSTKRQLTAKGYKFISKMVDFAAEQRGLTRYHKEMRPLQSKLHTIVTQLIVDKRLDESQIKEIVRNSVNAKPLI